MSIINICGLIGSFLFMISGMPQAWKSYKDGHSDGIAHLTIWFWWIGELLFLTYVIGTYPNDFILMGNYLLNVLVVSVILKFKYFKRK